ncbi:LWR-salt protein [Halostella salina]|uniref:LWR-salt protein n=1 Tax=Halostella salina TaxID=1547897 RepID=UPI000EF7E554|nr:LWR-salt protein [Halostella salina]
MSGHVGTARYVFRVAFRLDPSPPGTTVDPATFETTLSREAAPPGDDGWLFFRDNLWRGELSDPEHFRALTEDALGVTVAEVSFSELRTDEAYLDALRDEVGASLDEFNADTVDDALSKYLGSSIHVLPDPETR